MDLNETIEVSRAQVREARAAIKDMKNAIREFREAMKEAREAFSASVDETSEALSRDADAHIETYLLPSYEAFEKAIAKKMDKDFREWVKVTDDWLKDWKHNAEKAFDTWEKMVRYTNLEWAAMLNVIQQHLPDMIPDFKRELSRLDKATNSGQDWEGLRH